MTSHLPAKMGGMEKRAYYDAMKVDRLNKMR